MALSVIGRNQIALNVNSLEWQSLKSASFTASAGEAYPIDTTSGAVTVTLPASPSEGHTVQVLDVAATADTNFITLARNGNNINGSASNVALGKERGVVSVVYSGSSQGWFVSSTAGTGATSIGKILAVDALIIAGGGSGASGYGNGNGSGGGGAGGLLYVASKQVLEGYSYAVTVGAGGAQQTANRGSQGGGQVGNDGNDSVFGGSTAIGGGGGGSPNTGGRTGRDGGSGGGGGGGNGHAGGSGTSGQGNNGGAASTGGVYRGGGGGGAGAVGTAGSSTPNGGAGLNTYSAFTTATSTGVSGYYAGGGGGGDYTGDHSSGSGGAGGGGSGAGGTNSGGAATANTGSGGGGGGSPSTGSTGGAGGAGGSGIVIIRYLGSQTASGGTVVVSGGYAYHTFLSSGTYTA